MIDCVLVYPNPSLDSPNRNLALGVMIVGAALEQRGFSVEYIDLRFDTVARLRDIVRGGVRTVGVSAMTGEQCLAAAEIFEWVKQASPATKTILGGVHGSMVTESCIQEPDIDFIVVGEGEETMCRLMEAVRDNARDLTEIEGLAWKAEGEPRINPPRAFSDLSDSVFPLTARNKRLFEIAASTGHLSYYTTRGCPFRCAFCYNLVFNRRKWRQLPADRLEEDLRRLRKEISFDHVYMVDDYIGRRLDRLEAISRSIRNVGLTWHSSIRVNDVNAESARILRDGNCQLLLLGVESASESVQQGTLVKDYKNGEADVRSCVVTLRDAGITPLYSFMYNVPGETEEDLVDTARLAEWIYRTDTRARIGFYAYTPYPGTPLYKDALERGFTPPLSLRDWAHLSLSNELNPKLRDLYYIAGLRFRGRKGDRTDENFPRFQRLRIAPFELAARVRWRFMRFVMTDFERESIKKMIRQASRRDRERELHQQSAKQSNLVSSLAATAATAGDKRDCVAETSTAPVGVTRAPGVERRSLPVVQP